MEQLDTLSSQISFASDGNQFLTFALAGEEYGVEILKVQEIRGYSDVTAIPNTPAHLKGVMDLRGTIIPVVDLRTKLSMPEAEYSSFTVIIVLKVTTKVMGVIVDGVSDVLNIPRSDIQPAPDFGADMDTRFIRGMAKAGDKLVALLDMDRVLLGDAAVELVAAPSRRRSGRESRSG